MPGRKGRQPGEADKDFIELEDTQRMLIHAVDSSRR